MDQADINWDTGRLEADPLATFAHELGHYAQWRKNKDKWNDEREAERFGQLLLAHVP